MGSKIGLYTIYKSDNGYNRKTATLYTSSEPSFVLFELLRNNYFAVIMKDKKSLEVPVDNTNELLIVEYVDLYDIGIMKARNIQDTLKYNRLFKELTANIKMDGLSYETKKQMMENVWDTFSIRNENESIYNLAVNRKMVVRGDTTNSVINAGLLSDIVDTSFCTEIAKIYNDEYCLGCISNIDELRIKLQQYFDEFLYPISEYFDVMSSLIAQIKKALSEKNDSEFINKIKINIDLPEALNFLEENKNGVQE